MRAPSARGPPSSASDSLDPRPALAQVAAHVPEPRERAQPQGSWLSAVDSGVLERRADVVVLPLGLVERRRRYGARARGASARSAKCCGVAPPRRVRVPRLEKALERVLADGLEHREARFAGRAGRRAARGSSRPASRATSSSAPHTSSAASSVQPPAKTESRASSILLLGRRAGRSSSRSSRAASAAGRAGRAGRRRARRADSRAARATPRARAASCAPRRARARAASRRGTADRCDRGGVLVRELEAGRAARARATKSATASVPRDRRRDRRRLGRELERRDAVLVLGARAAAARGSSRAPGGRRAQRAAPRRAARPRARARSCRARAGRRRSPTASADPLDERLLLRVSPAEGAGDRRADERRRPRAGRGRRSNAVRRSSSRSSRAASRASRVLPVPPGPVRVTRRTSGRRAASAVTAASSSSRPIERRRRRRQVTADVAAAPANASSAVVLAQDRRMELVQRARRARSRARRRARSGSPVGLERIRLPARAVEREHRAGRRKPLAVRVLGDERLELGHELRMAAELEVGVDPALERDEPRAPRCARARPPTNGASRQVGQRCAAVERERLAERRPRRSPALGLCPLDELLEALEIELVRLGATSR